MRYFRKQSLNFMDQITKVESIASIGALIVSTGTFIYLNNKISTSEESLKKFSDRFDTIVFKLNEVDDQNKISKAKLTEVNSLKDMLHSFNSNFSTLKEEVTYSMDIIEQVINKQNKKLNKLQQQIQVINQSLGINTSVDIDEDEDEVKAPPKKRARKPIKPVTPKQKKPEYTQAVVSQSNDKELEENVLAELSKLNVAI